jgi:hypothetical protein
VKVCVRVGYSESGFGTCLGESNAIGETETSHRQCDSREEVSAVLRIIRHYYMQLRVSVKKDDWGLGVHFVPRDHLHHSCQARPAVFQVHPGDLTQEREFLRANCTLVHVLADQRPAFEFLFPCKYRVYQYGNAFPAVAAIQLDVLRLTNPPGQPRNLTFPHSLSTFGFVTQPPRILRRSGIMQNQMPPEFRRPQTLFLPESS